MSDQKDDEIHGFDETNGVVSGLDGESDGSARGDTESKRDQAREDLDTRASNIIGGGLGSRRL